jgi:hypothetical protein
VEQVDGPSTPLVSFLVKGVRGWPPRGLPASPRRPPRWTRTAWRTGGRGGILSRSLGRGAEGAGNLVHTSVLYRAAEAGPPRGGATQTHWKCPTNQHPRRLFCTSVYTVLLLETLRSKVFTGRVSSFQGFFNCLPVGGLQNFPGFPNGLPAQNLRATPLAISQGPAF